MTRQPGRIILLNGTGSAGKSSIARALQELDPTPLLHLGMDTFYIDVCPPKFLFSLVPVGTDPGPLAEGTEAVRFLELADPAEGTALTLPPFGDQLLSAMHHAVAAVVAQGNEVIVDHVLWYTPWLLECLRLWRPFAVFFVQVHCPLPVLEAREFARSDRSVKGAVRWQYQRVHQHNGLSLPYDLTVDTAAQSPQECAQQILAGWATTPPTAFAELAATLPATVETGC